MKATDNSKKKEGKSILPVLPAIKITELEQIGYVVRDCEKSAQSMWENFGIGPWRIVNIPIEFTTEQTYRGKPGRFGFRAAMTITKVGGIEFELIEPTEGKSIYRDFLDEHGDGIHHLGWHKLPTLAAFDKTTEALERAGFPCLMSGKGPGVAYGYFDATKSLNTIIETIWSDTSKSLPLPVIHDIFPVPKA
jgi:methylmalonyl-CoA/ethylmalonyl-CoA epimerase